MALIPKSAWTVKHRRVSWSERDVIIYALGIGLGETPLDPGSLGFVYENRLRPMPTFLTALARTCIPTVSELGGDHSRAVHAEQRAEFHAPIPAVGDVDITGFVVAVHDRGPDRGALLHCRAELHLPDGTHLATLDSHVLARADGAVADPQSSRANFAGPPDRSADKVVQLTTSLNQGVIYRLSGDYNPLHIDPEAAQQAGFPKPILHGLCTYGLACRAVMEHCADGDASRIRSHVARFTAPLFPGEALKLALWVEQGSIAFEAWAAERATKVLSGRTELVDLNPAHPSIKENAL